MSSIHDDYEASWKMVHRVWEDLQELAPDNEWVQYYDGATLQQHAVADLLWSREEFVQTRYGLLHLLAKYQECLERELRQLEASGQGMQNAQYY